MSWRSRPARRTQLRAATSRGARLRTPRATAAAYMAAVAALLLLAAGPGAATGCAPSSDAVQLGAASGFGWQLRATAAPLRRRLLWCLAAPRPAVNATALGLPLPAGTTRAQAQALPLCRCIAAAAGGSGGAAAAAAGAASSRGCLDEAAGAKAAANLAGAGGWH